MNSETGAAAAGEPREDADESPIGEPRWPPAVALVVFLALNVTIRLWLPGQAAVRAPWLLPGVEAVLLVVLFAYRGGLHVRARLLHRVTLALVLVLVVASLWATVLLVYDLIEGRSLTNDPSELLASGALVWLGNNISFGLFYWLFDGGGPIARQRRSVPLDFAFTQHQNPELAPPGWRPEFLDYLHLGFTNATAFSPTDVLPLSHRGKYTMLVQSTISLALFGLVVARAVNAFQ